MYKTKTISVINCRWQPWPKSTICHFNPPYDSRTQTGHGSCQKIFHRNPPQHHHGRYLTTLSTISYEAQTPKTRHRVWHIDTYCWCANKHRHWHIFSRGVHATETISELQSKSSFKHRKKYSKIDKLCKISHSLFPFSKRKEINCYTSNHISQDI